MSELAAQNRLLQERVEQAEQRLAVLERNSAAPRGMTTAPYNNCMGYEMQVPENVQKQKKAKASKKILRIPDGTTVIAAGQYRDSGWTRIDISATVVEI